MPTALAFAMKIIDLAPLVIRGAQGAAQAMTWGRAAIKTMVAEQREPTPAEWDALNAMTAALGDELLTD